MNNKIKKHHDETTPHPGSGNHFLPTDGEPAPDMPSLPHTDSALDFPPRNPRALAKIPSQIVAKVAALLHNPESNTGDSIMKAYELLDAAESARNSLVESGSYAHGIREFNWARNHFRATRNLEREILTAPAFFWGTRGDPRLDLDQVLNSLFGGKKRKLKPSERQSRIDRLVDFLQYTSSTPGIAVNFFGRARQADFLRWERWGVERQLAEKLVEDWSREGIPGKSFPTLKHHFPGWWENQISQKNSKNRKGKTRKPLKSTDGRRGARTPTFFEALKKTT